MYKVYADNILIHDSRSPENIMHLISPKLTLVDNGAGSFDMTIPEGNPGYDIIQRMSTTIKITKDNDTIWTGRVINENEDFAKRRKFGCEGALSFLNDSLQELAYYDNHTISAFFTALINIHNNKVSANRRFEIGTISVTDAKVGFEYKTDYKSTLESLNDNLFSRLVGHVRIRYGANSDTPIIDYLQDYPNTSAQDINFGNNLLDFTKDWDLSNLVTVVFPRGTQLEEENDHGDKEYLTIASVNHGIKFLENPDAVEAFGRIERIVDFNEIDNPTTLLNLGQVYLGSLQFDEMSLKVSAVDLHYLNPDIVSFELLDQVRCFSKPHGLNKVFPITQIDIPLDSPDNVTYTMGISERSDLTSKSVKSSKGIQNEIAVTKNNLLNDAKHQATELINQKTTGYVNIITENETSQAIIISDEPDLENATRLWRWNLNGLGYLNKEDTPLGDYSLAITNNGVIVADFIKAGVLSDGAHRNYWNLATGELSISFNSELFNENGNNITINDLVDVSQRGYALANTANNKQYGTNNLLNGSAQLKIGIGLSDYWGNGTWQKGTGGLPIIVEDLSNGPNNKIRACAFLDTSIGGRGGTIEQHDILAYPNTVYTMSCYAKGTGVLLVQAGYEFLNGTKVFVGKKGNVTADNRWRRYYFTFKTGENNSIYGEDVAGIYDNKINAYFGIVSGSVRLCGFQLERGNAPTDWGESSWDIEQNANNYTEEYTTELASTERDFTNAQLGALDQSFSQEKLLKRLTNGYKNTGLYISDQGELLMNASYIRSGTINAGIIQTGIITDVRRDNKWNLASGFFKATNIEANRIHADGEFRTGDPNNAHTTFDGCGIATYDTGRENSSDRRTYVNVHHNIQVPGAQQGKGIEIGATAGIEFRAPRFLVSQRMNDTGNVYVAWTGKLDYKCVSEVSLSGSRVSRTLSPHGLECINGIVINAW